MVGRGNPQMYYFVADLLKGGPKSLHAKDTLRKRENSSCFSLPSQKLTLLGAVILKVHVVRPFIPL